MNKSLPTISYWKPTQFFDKHKICHVCKRFDPDTKNQAAEMLVLTHNAVKHYFGVCQLHKDAVNALIRNYKLAEPKTFMSKLSSMTGLALFYNDVVYDEDLLPSAKSKITYAIPEYTNQ